MHISVKSKISTFLLSLSKSFQFSSTFLMTVTFPQETVKCALLKILGHTPNGGGLKFLSFFSINDRPFFGAKDIFVKIGTISSYNGICHESYWSVVSTNLVFTTNFWPFHLTHIRPRTREFFKDFYSIHTFVQIFYISFFSANDMLSPLE